MKPLLSIRHGPTSTCTGIRFPQDNSINVASVLCFIALKLFVKGLKDVDQALALDGGNAMFYILRAKLRWKLGFIQKGNQDVLTAYNIDPKNKEANQYHYLLQNESLREYDMACSSILERKYDKALQHISQAESIDADDTKILQTKAIILRKLVNDLSLTIFNYVHIEAYQRSICYD